MTKTLTHEAAAQADLWRKYRLGPIQHIWRIIVGLVAAHAGTLVIVALYYMAFELNPSATHWSHTTVSNGDLRHTIRDVAEGVLGAFLAKAVIWNHFTKRHIKSGRVYDWLKRTLRLPETPTAIFAALLTFAALFALGYWVLEKLKVQSVATAIHGGVWAHTQAIRTDGYVNKILAFVCTFIAVRPLHNVYDDKQGYFEGKRAARYITDGKRRPPFFYPGNIKNRFNYLVAYPDQLRTYGQWATVVLPVLTVIGFAMVVYGWYILAYIA